MKKGKYSQRLVSNLEEKALRIRQLIVEMVYRAGSGHPGGSLSAVEIVTALYFHVMRIRPKEPRWEGRDRFILSKGHACPVLYAALALRGFFPIRELYTLRKINSILQGHPDMKKTPGVDMTSGSLGHGLSVGVGMALAAKLDNRSYRVYVLLGDGELQEGLVWEAAMAAAHYKLDNLTAIVDYNGLQVDGRVSDIMEVAPVAEKWRSFGWRVIEIDGHDFYQILESLEVAKKNKNCPLVIVARTVKGKGVSFMENVVDWHGKAPTEEEYRLAMEGLRSG